MPFLDIRCPYCGEPIELFIDSVGADGSAASQRYIEDCQVCCKPIDVTVSVDDRGEIAVTARAENER